MLQYKIDAMEKMVEAQEEMEIRQMIEQAEGKKGSQMHPMPQKQPTQQFQQQKTIKQQPPAPQQQYAQQQPIQNFQKVSLLILHISLQILKNNNLSTPNSNLSTSNNNPSTPSSNSLKSHPKISFLPTLAGN